MEIIKDYLEEKFKEIIENWIKKINLLFSKY